MTNMPDKRKPSGSVTGYSPYAKRSRPSYAEEDDEEEAQPTVTPYERPRNHPVYGQKSAFPGLDVAGDDELFYGPAEDGLEYLRMVRSEANSLPFLFTAPQTTESTAATEQEQQQEQVQNGGEPQQQHEEVKDVSEPVPEGVVVDGVYFVPHTSKTNITAAPAADVADEGISDAQSSYYNLLHHRFLLLRSILKCTPPSEAIAGLDESHPISLPRHSRNARKEWRRLLLAVDPQTVQLACMDMESVLGVLEIMARLMSENVRSGDAQRCRDVGQLGTEEVGEIRDLGKRAVKILRKMREEDEKKMQEGDGSDEEDAEDETGENAAEGEDGAQQVDGPSDDQDHDMQDVEEEKPATAEELEAAKARLQAKLAGGEEQPAVTEPEVNNEEPTNEAATQTRAMLDMIITKPETMPPTTLEITIPTTSISATQPPYTLYNITLRLPLRSFTISKRYSDFTTFHNTLTSQTNAPPPAPLPPKSWFQNTINNATLRESRREALEAYLRAINESDDPRWRNSPAWRAFLNLPSLPSNNNSTGGGGGTGASTRLHAAITDPGDSEGGGITDPILWLDCFRDMKGHLHDARLYLTRRDQETTPQRQHESSARAKSELVRAGGLIGSLESGLRNLSNSSTSSGGGEENHNNNAGSRPGSKLGRRNTATTVATAWSVSGNNTLGEGEMRRRKDLLINARKEKDGLEDLLNAMAAKSRIDSAVASIQDKEALMGTQGGKKAIRSSGRVLGRETERTRELDNSGVVQLQKQMMQDQDVAVDELMRIVNRQKELGIAINNELQVQNELLNLADEDATRLGGKIDIGKKRIGRIS
ncbi:hypothetical protein BO83DRAFT_406225 [Aspergillus eucalypticola CBS 122712]|uniref:SNARE complex subunit n=1 Tax=Aspergillus eucalypticola (strain CBS 122712 / IBT 29274) TaxID=1448314 RepID=A0A317W0E8_ASPEC|nr:uncharacterized protein BO83DRAFT_406225 [Aspergillus eucalypticola CBS 122712]PWY80126.1 hypothetical protein BO83DRAFT_406225 [Aspergillus eucalypticola CBS 122712]